MPADAPTAFDRLLDAVEEMRAIEAGQQAPAREYVYEGVVLVEVREEGQAVWNLRTSRASADPERPDPAAIRSQLRQSREGMAALLGVSVGTLRGWEEGRREPGPPARALLRVVARHPAAVLDSLPTAA